jgi:hypothetical protein
MGQLRKKLEDDPEHPQSHGPTPKIAATFCARTRGSPLFGRLVFLPLFAERQSTLPDAHSSMRRK